MNREQYLNEGVQHLATLFADKGYEVPEVRVSCSWPGGGSALKRVGECWPRRLSAGNVNEIFISPRIDDAVKALDILAHELVHAVDDCQHGHRKEFTKIMRAIGLEGKPTATHAGERLHDELASIVADIGEYPHDKLTPPAAKQKSRQLKASCTECGAVWRMSKQWLEKAVVCPCCKSTEIEIN